MAFTDGGSLGGEVLPKVSGTTVSTSVGGPVAADSLLVVVSAWDNTATASGPTTMLSCSDSVGNTYNKIAEQTYSAGTAETGVTGSMWVSKLTTGLTNTLGHAWTITSSTARIAKVIGVWLFTMGSGPITFGGTVGKDYQVATAAAADPASIALSGLTSREYLFLHMCGTEAGTTHTTTGSWTEGFDNLETTGGSAASNVAVYFEYQIATATSISADITSNVDRDHMQIIAAVYEGVAASSDKRPQGIHINKQAQHRASRW